MEHNRVVYERQYDAEVEYLEHRNKQTPVIDTQVKLSSNIRFETKLIIGSGVGWVFGFNKKGENNLALHYGKWCWGRKEFAYGTAIPKMEIIILSTLDEPNILKMNGSVVAPVVFSEFTSDSNFYLFSADGTGGGVRYDRIYYFKIYDGDLLIRDYIPVRKGNIGYMLDKVTHRLFGSINSNNFTLGPDIVNPVPNIRRVFQFDNKRFVAINND